MKKRKFFAMLIALCMVITFVPTAALAVETASVTEQTNANDDIQYVPSVSIPDGDATNSIFLN